MGARNIYSEEVADKICDRLASGESLRQICRDKGMPHISTVLRWVTSDLNGFMLPYARAREAQGHLDADELVRINDDLKIGIIDPATARVMSDNHKWLAERRAPKSFSPTQILEHRKGDDARSDEDLLNELQQLSNRTRFSVGKENKAKKLQ